MADNVDITPGSGATVGTKDIGSGVQVQRVQPNFGPSGSGTDVSLTTPLPVRMGTPTTGITTPAQISAANANDNALLAGTGGQTIRVFKLFMKNMGSVVTNFKFRSGTTDLHPALELKPRESFTLDMDGEPWLVTADGETLNLNLSAAAQISGRFYYTKSA